MYYLVTKYHGHPSSTSLIVADFFVRLDAYIRKSQKKTTTITPLTTPKNDQFSPLKKMDGWKTFGCFPL